MPWVKNPAPRDYPYDMNKDEWLAWICYISGMRITQIAYSVKAPVSIVRSRLKMGRQHGAPLRFGLPSTEIRTGNERKKMNADREVKRRARINAEKRAKDA